MDDTTGLMDAAAEDIEVAVLNAADVLAADEPDQLQLVEHARTLACDPAFASLDDQALVTELGRGASQVAAAMCRYLEVLAEVMVRGIWADHGARTPARWLSYEVGVGRSTAHDHIRVALRLRELPKIRARFAAGRISYCKVRAITRVAVPQLEDMLLMWCESATGSEIERIVSTFRRCRRAVQDERVADRQRSVRSRCNGDGTTSVVVRLPDDEAAELVSHLERLVDLDDTDPTDSGSSEATDGPSEATDGSSEAADGSSDGNEGSGDADRLAPHPSSAEDEWRLDDEPSSAEDAATVVTWDSVDPSSAEDVSDADRIAALLALDQPGIGVEIPLGPPPRHRPVDDDGPLLHPDRPRGARMADALIDAVATAVAAGGTDTTGLDRHTLVLHAELAHLAQDPSTDTDDPGDPSDPGDPGGTTSGAAAEDAHVPVHDVRGRVRALSTRVLRRLACQAGIVLHTTGDSSPLDMGRRTRQPTVAQRRALLARDRSCRFPGCATTRNLHAHHIVHWADDGPTDLDNLIVVCAFHHRFVHDHDWSITPTRTGAFEFAPPDRSPLPAAGSLPGADGSISDSYAAGFGDGRPLRPTAYWPPHNLNLNLAISVLHQELDAAAGSTIPALAA